MALPPHIVPRMVPAPPTGTCLICAWHGGQLRPNGHAQNIPPGARDAHEAGTKHLDRARRPENVHFAQQVPPNHFIMNAPVFQQVFRCVVCSVNPSGFRRHEHSSMSGATMLAHINGGEHARRLLDGRMALYDILHPIGNEVLARDAY